VKQPVLIPAAVHAKLLAKPDLVQCAAGNAAVRVPALALLCRQAGSSGVQSNKRSAEPTAASSPVVLCVVAAGCCCSRKLLPTAMGCCSPRPPGCLTGQPPGWPWPAHQQQPARITSSMACATCSERRAIYASLLPVPATTALLHTPCAKSLPLTGGICPARVAAWSLGPEKV